MIETLNFLAPALHPNTLLDISIPEPGPSTRDPIVRILPIKYGDHQSVGNIKRLVKDAEGNYIAVDDAYRLSTISLKSNEASEKGPLIPEIVNQYSDIKHRAGDTWSGLIPVKAGSIAALTSGTLTFYPPSGSSRTLSRSVPSPLLALSSEGEQATNFALAGKEVDVSLWDVERTFAGDLGSEKSTATGKRKKAELERGEIWRAKNSPNNSLSIRPPNHHLSLAHLTLAGPNHLVSGTKSGTIRRYDTRQRKPVNEWKIAREGGIAAVAQGQDEHEVFFADRANLLGAVDLRTGRLLYSYPNQTATTHHILPLPVQPPSSSSSLNLGVGLATVSSDATLRVHSTLPPKAEGQKGNVGSGRKAKVEGMVGGVGIASFLYMGRGEIEEVKVSKKASKPKGQDGDNDGDEDGEDDEESGDEEVWEEMSEVEEGDEEEDSDEEEVPVKSKKSRK